MDTDTPNLLSPENYATLLSWINGDSLEKPPFAEEFIRRLEERYSNLTGRHVRRHTPGSTLSLTYIIEQADKGKDTDKEDNTVKKENKPEPEKKPETAPSIPEKIVYVPPMAPASGTLPIENEEGFIDAGIDSLTVAEAIAWCHSRMDTLITKGKPISMSSLQISLYIIYGFYLAQRNARLTKEHPQMWKYGPVFPRVYDKMRNSTGKAESFREINEHDPALGEFIQRTVSDSVNTSLRKTVENYMKKGTAYSQCLEREGEKWATPIPDTDIKAEFLKRLRN